MIGSHGREPALLRGEGTGSTHGKLRAARDKGKRGESIRSIVLKSYIVGGMGVKVTC